MRARANGVGDLRGRYREVDEDWAPTLVSFGEGVIGVAEEDIFLGVDNAGVVRVRVVDEAAGVGARLSRGTTAPRAPSCSSQDSQEGNREQVRVTVLEMTIVGDATGAATAMHIYTRRTPRFAFGVFPSTP